MGPAPGVGQCNVKAVYIYWTLLCSNFKTAQHWLNKHNNMNVVRISPRHRNSNFEHRRKQCAHPNVPTSSSENPVRLLDGATLANLARMTIIMRAHA